MTERILIRCSNSLAQATRGWWMLCLATAIAANGLASAQVVDDREPTFDDLIRQLHSSDASMRLYAIDDFEFFEYRVNERQRAILELNRLLEDPLPAVRIAAASPPQRHFSIWASRSSLYCPSLLPH